MKHISQRAQRIFYFYVRRDGNITMDEAFDWKIRTSSIISLIGRHRAVHIRTADGRIYMLTADSVTRELRGLLTAYSRIKP